MQKKLLGRSLFCFMALLAFTEIACRAQTDAQDEATVRNTYATVRFLCGLPPVTKAAFQEMNGGHIDSADLEAQEQDATPIFDLSDFSTGALQSIADRHWSDLVTLPNVQVLKVKPTTQKFNAAEWRELTLKWGDAQYAKDERIQHLATNTFGQIQKQAKETGLTADLTRYVSYTVNVTFHGQSTGQYKALFLFGVDNGKPVVFARDLVLEDALNKVLLGKDEYPSGLLTSPLRNTNTIEQWTNANRRDDAVCTGASNLCCTGDRCGLRESYVRRDINAPIQNK